MSELRMIPDRLLGRLNEHLTQICRSLDRTGSSPENLALQELLEKRGE